MSVEIVFAAIGDPTRRAIIERLSRSDATVNELAKPFPVTLQGVAKHVRILETAGLIRKKKIGRSYHCSLNQSSLSIARGWIDDLEKDWNARLDRLDVYLNETSIQEAEKKPTDNNSNDPSGQSPTDGTQQ